MKKNAWVKYWERVDKNFIWGGFGESDPYIIKFIYFITFNYILIYNFCASIFIPQKIMLPGIKLIYTTNFG